MNWKTYEEFCELRFREHINSPINAERKTKMFLPWACQLVGEKKAAEIRDRIAKENDRHRQKTL